MKKESINELNEMLFLMERMDKHYTIQEVNMIKEGKVDRSETLEIDNLNYNLKTPEDLYQALTKIGVPPQKGWFVTLGYIESFDKLGDKNISSSIESFNDDDIQNARQLNDPRLNNLIDNPQKNKKGFMTNPYKPDSYTNYIVRAKVMQLVYGGMEDYAKQKEDVKKEIEQYQNSNKEKVQHYLMAKGLTDFVGQSYDDARNQSGENINGFSGKKYDDGSYNISFRTPKTQYKVLEYKYFLIKDANTIEEISKETAETYAKMYGVVQQHKVNKDDDIVKEVDQAIKEIKKRYHGESVFTTYKSDSIFLLKFATQDGHKKLIYNNENAIVKFIKERKKTSGNEPAVYTSKGAMSKYLGKDGSFSKYLK